MLTVGSLCSGYGGIELALSSVVDCDLSWFAEFEDAPAKVMTHHHPGVPNLQDLTKIDWTTVAPVDVLTAGFPCQPFSHAGKRLGANDERHLWPHIAQAIDALRPRLALLENVRGLLSAQGEPDPEWVAELARKSDRWKSVIHHVIEPKIRKARRRGQLDRITRLEADAVRLLEQRRVALDTVRRARSRLVRAIGVVARDLANIGYVMRWYGLRAADVGAAHGRFRVFLFAVPADSDDQGLQGLAGQARAASTGRHGHSVAGVGGSALTLLPTPTSSDTNGAGAHGTGGPDLRTAVTLLPTPSVADGMGGHLSRSGDRSHELLLPGVAKRLGEQSELTLLPTSAVNDMGEGKDVDAWDAWTERMRAAHGNGNGHGKSLAIEAQRMLLPTPTVDDAGNVTRDSGAFQSLTRTAVSLLPTPSAEHRDRSTATAKLDGSRDFRDLGSVAELNRWGDYAPAIVRWEAVLGRIAPSPTEPNAKGGHRLSPRFVEFLMGVPEGWVCDVPGITRNQALKALGNGIVPQQCAAALRAFLWDAYGIGAAA